MKILFEDGKIYQKKMFKKVEMKNREMSIVLTESGKKFAVDILSELYKKEAEVFKTLSIEEQKIVEVLEKLVQKLKGEK